MGAGDGRDVSLAWNDPVIIASGIYTDAEVDRLHYSTHKKQLLSPAHQQQQQQQQQLSAAQQQQQLLAAQQKHQLSPSQQQQRQLSQNVPGFAGGQMLAQIQKPAPKGEGGGGTVRSFFGLAGTGMVKADDACNDGSLGALFKTALEDSVALTCLYAIVVCGRGLTTPGAMSVFNQTGF